MSTPTEAMQEAISFYQNRGYFVLARSSDCKQYTLADGIGKASVTLTQRGEGEVRAQLGAMSRGLVITFGDYQWNHPQFDYWRNKMEAAVELIEENL